MTLIELMLVIGLVVFLLAAVIYPVFLRARWSAWRVTCTSNLSQIGKAIQIYRSDHDGHDAAVGVPMEYYHLGLPPSIVALHPKYLNCNSGIYHCPLDPGDPPHMKKAMSYGWGVFWPGERAFGDWGPTFADLVAQRGEEYMIANDILHNSPDENRRGTQAGAPVFKLLLRMNGQVEAKRSSLNADPATE